MKQGHKPSLDMTKQKKTGGHAKNVLIDLPH
jgi:hypothetical protein